MVFSRITQRLSFGDGIYAAEGHYLQYPKPVIKFAGYEKSRYGLNCGGYYAYCKRAYDDIEQEYAGASGRLFV